MFAFFSPGPMEMVIIGGIAVLLFGKRLPEVGRSLGKGIVEFKKGINGIEDDISSASSESNYTSQSTATTTETDELDTAAAPKFVPLSERGK